MSHACHAIKCGVLVKPQKLFCAKHWRMTPKELRDAVLKTYRDGQCDDKRPSREWMTAARAAITAVHEREKAQP